MKREGSSKRDTIGTDAIFLGSFLLTIGFSIVSFLDFLFIVPALASFFVWLSLTIIVLRRMGVSPRTALLQRRLVSGLPSNKRLHAFYIATLLVSLNLFFALMIIELGLYSLLAFMVWLFIGSQATQELSGKRVSKKGNRTIIG
jgi:uncharacterized membrane protein